MEKNNSNETQENPDNEYIGNIWGWKFSFISLGIIVAMLLLMLFRYSVINKHPPSSDQRTITIEKDSSHLESRTTD